MMYPFYCSCTSSIGTFGNLTKNIRGSFFGKQEYWALIKDIPWEKRACWRIKALGWTGIKKQVMLTLYDSMLWFQRFLWNIKIQPRSEDMTNSIYRGLDFYITFPYSNNYRCISIFDNRYDSFCWRDIEMFIPSKYLPSPPQSA